MTVRGELLDWSGCANARDVGGLPTGDGRVMASGVLLRTDSLDQLDAGGLQTVRGLHPGLVLDLRSDFETAAGDHPLGDDPAYRIIPFVDPARDIERVAETEHTLADRYLGSVERNGSQVAAIMRAIAEAPDGPVIVHCASGKDRTGLLIALLLDLVGVPGDVICDDYSRSEELLDLTDHEHPLNRTSPQTMAKTLEHLHHRWGGAAGYLEAHGVNAAVLDRVRDRLLDRRP